MIKIALIDDDEEDRMIFKGQLKVFPVQVETYIHSKDFKENAQPVSQYDFIFIDATVNHYDGVDKIMEDLQKEHPEVQVILISHASVHLAEKYRTEPMIKRLFLKSNPSRILNWMESRLFEIDNPECAYT